MGVSICIPCGESFANVRENCMASIVRLVIKQIREKTCLLRLKAFCAGLVYLLFVRWVHGRSGVSPQCGTVGGKNSATLAVVAFFERQSPAWNYRLALGPHFKYMCRVALCHSMPCHGFTCHARPYFCVPCNIFACHAVS